ncbi:MAG: flippase-like domain-containing protein, partial [Acidimicrobiia bacterium]|nr:flippase-like domain-containing protein [Acidimicrobiia bacterium]
EVLERNGFPSYPVSRLAMTVAAIRVVGPYLSVPMRKVGHRLVFAMSISALVMSYGTTSAVFGGLGVGAAAAAAIHLIFGSGLGIPSRERIVAALQEVDLDVADIEFLPIQPVGANLVRADLDDGSRLLVKVYGRDAADAALASRLWRAIWYRDSDRRLLVTSGQLAEHESLIMLACERSGVPTAPLVGWSRASTDDTILISRWVDGSRLSQLDADAIDDATLDQAWQTLADFHAAGIVHGEIERERIVVTEGHVLLTDLSAARILADHDAKEADVAQLLVATAVTVGNEQAIAAARRRVGDEQLLDVLPLLQAAALPRALQRDAKTANLKIAELRSEVATALDTTEPEIVKLQRVSWANVAMAALTVFAAYSLITALTDIGLDTLANEMGDAAWAWVIVALLMAQLTNVGEYYTLVGVVGSPIPFGPTILFRYALSFISLAVPSEAGAIAMNVRYQQKLGVPAAAAIAQGPLLTIISKGFDIILLVLSAKFIGEAIDAGQVEFGPIVQLVVAVVVMAVLAIAVVLAFPALRTEMLPHVKEGFSAVKGSLTDPERLMKIVGGTLLQKILFALTLASAVAAFGANLRFGEAIFVNTAVSLFVGLVPVPGGIGVAEAALTAALVAVGIPQEAAVAAALTHRMVTAYIPPVFGWWSQRWLVERDYL